jgi:signal transduction histidine kinase
MRRMGSVLCVDDDRAALSTLTRALRSIVQVVAAASAEEARAAIRPEVAAIVSDYRMPGTCGTALLAEVRERDPTIGRILLTAYADPDILMEAINQGHVHRYLTKPWDPRELRAAVGHAIAGAEAERERRRLSADMAEAYARLRELDDLKTRVVTLAAHELRTPLHVLGGTIDALAVLVPTAEATDALLATARRNLAWLERSVRAMTDVARLTRAAPLTAMPLCLAALTRAAAAEVAPFCAARHLTLRCQAAQPVPVAGDGSDLHHALINLLLNAIRFTPDGGDVTVRAWMSPEGGAIVSVADTGIGIAVADRPRIGEPFFTVAPLAHHHSHPTAFQSGGIGLGLTVARAVAAAHGGRLRFESDEGKGTTFYLEIPAARRP